MKTVELTGAALDWAVAKIEQEWTDEDRWYNTIGYVDTGDVDDEPYYPSTNWAQGGPIIEREGMGVWAYQWNEQGEPEAGWYAEDKDGDHVRTGTTPLIAAMRCYVAAKLGGDIEIPEELNV